MYLLPEFVDHGLKNEERWPSEAHRKVAIAAAIGNGRVTTMDALQEVVRCVIQVPLDRIKTITFEELANEFNCPFVG